MEKEKEKEKEEKPVLTKAEFGEKIKNAQPLYLEQGKKQYLLASSQESLSALINSQKEELSRVLVDLKTEYDHLTLDSANTKNMISEYDKRIKMLQSADKKYEQEEDNQKEMSEGMKNDISAKKGRREEEKFNQKTLTKQVEKLNKDIFILQKQIIQCENESKLLDKKKERAQINKNIINEKKNKVHSKIEDQTEKNKYNAKENEAKIQQYNKIIELKEEFLKFGDERKEIQNQIAQQAKNESQDKQEVEKRKMLKLLMLYNQFLRNVMEEQLRDNEVLENIFVKIRDICGTQDLQKLVDFILLRNKRYNYECEEIKKSEEKKVVLKRELK